MAQKSLKREEATYTLVDGHFAIDCACGNKGSRFEIRDGERNDIDELLKNFRSQHTFYANRYVMKKLLADSPGNSLEFACKGCKREFLLTSESYQEIIDKINE